jgi:hypothetical protein
VINCDEFLFQLTAGDEKMINKDVKLTHCNGQKNYQQTFALALDFINVALSITFPAKIFDVSGWVNL